ncbi:MAG TPA: FbpB family small basic protein [Bacillota bacterium]|nr:FbpB family small basic protein [Bacillota bacterium]
MAISLKKRQSFEELVQANREQILQDKQLMDQIELNMERRWQQVSKRSKKEA